MALPEFPAFADLRLVTKADIEAYTASFAPYSDYNYTSLWSWDVDGAIAVSSLHGNLVIRFTDYLTGEPFLSLLGAQHIRETVDALCDYARQVGLPCELRLVPSSVVEAGEESLAQGYEIIEDEDNHDYLFSIEGIASLKGSALHNQRNLVRRFLREHPACTVRQLDLSQSQVKESILSLFAQWAQTKELSPQDVQAEQTALSRHLDLAAAYPQYMIVLGIYDGDQLIAFASSEHTPPDHATAHFRKADNRRKGIYQYLEHVVAKHLHEQGIKHLNYEQDMGIEALRQSKRRWAPTHHLKKYILRPKQGT